MTSPSFGLADSKLGPATVALYKPNWGPLAPDCGPLNMKLDTCHEQFVMKSYHLVFECRLMMAELSGLLQGAAELQAGRESFQDTALADFSNCPQFLWHCELLDNMSVLLFWQGSFFPCVLRMLRGDPSGNNHAFVSAWLPGKAQWTLNVQLI